MIFVLNLCFLEWQTRCSAAHAHVLFQPAGPSSGDANLRWSRRCSTLCWTIIAGSRALRVPGFLGLYSRPPPTQGRCRESNVCAQSSLDVVNLSLPSLTSVVLASPWPSRSHPFHLSLLPLFLLVMVVVEWAREECCSECGGRWGTSSWEMGGSASFASAEGHQSQPGRLKSGSQVEEKFQRWGFQTGRRFASCLRGGGRGKFPAGRPVTGSRLLSSLLCGDQDQVPGGLVEVL